MNPRQLTGICPGTHSAAVYGWSSAREGVRTLRRFFPILLLWLPLIPASARGGDDRAVVSLISATYPPYARAVSEDGSVKPQSYAFGEGGDWSGSAVDSTPDDVNFVTIARLLAPELAKQGYVPAEAQDPKRADLLIMVYWGTTAGRGTPSSSSEYQIARQYLTLADLMEVQKLPTPGMNGMQNEWMKVDGKGDGVMQTKWEGGAAAGARAQGLLMISIANRKRDRQAAQNAGLLGYYPELHRVVFYRYTPFNTWNDVADEVEESRYFVVLLAYDFQSLWRAKQKKLLWQTRLSIRAHRADFGKQLAGMLRTASPYFGRDSRSLRREQIPEVTVRMGDMKVLESDVGGKK